MEVNTYLVPWFDSLTVMVYVTFQCGFDGKFCHLTFLNLLIISESTGESSTEESH